MKNRAPYFVICLLILLGSCVNEQQEQHIPDAETAEEEVAFAFPVIADTSSFPTSKREAFGIATANYELLYIGPQMDTLLADYRLDYGPLPAGSTELGAVSESRLKTAPYYVDWLNQDTLKSWNEAQIFIAVDTSQEIKNEDFYANWESPFFEAYPVIIQNRDTDSITICFGDYLSIITEALDTSGRWMPIEEPWVYTDAIGVGTLVLPPNELVLTSAPIYQGEFPTRLRLRMGSTYSTEFRGTINFKQFEKGHPRSGD